MRPCHVSPTLSNTLWGVLAINYTALCFIYRPYTLACVPTIGIHEAFRAESWNCSSAYKAPPRAMSCLHKVLCSHCRADCKHEGHRWPTSDVSCINPCLCNASSQACSCAVLQVTGMSIGKCSNHAPH